MDYLRKYNDTSFQITPIKTKERKFLLGICECYEYCVQLCVNVLSCVNRRYKNLETPHQYAIFRTSAVSERSTGKISITRHFNIYIIYMYRAR